MDIITTIRSLLMCNGSAQPVTVALMPNEQNLIAAAPELLEAVRALLASHRPGVGQCCKAADLGLAAIAKATGIPA